jgi:hypothetical protein
MIGLASVVDADVSLRLILPIKARMPKRTIWMPFAATESFPPFSLLCNIPPVDLFALTDHTWQPTSPLDSTPL